MDNLAKIEHPSGDIVFFVPNQATQWRVETVLTKEPDTIAWIGEMSAGDVFIDVGANMGLYTIWAAKTRGAKVYAFEPESQNFGLLNTNIYLNKSDAVAYPIALADKQSVGPLYLSQWGAGGSCHAFDEPTNFKGESLAPQFVQGSCGTTLDKLVLDNIIPQPDYIKIDVDGFEHKVIEGGAICLWQVKSVLVELNSNLDSHQAIYETMARKEFSFDPAEVEASQRKQGPFKGIGNVIFRREVEYVRR